MNIKEELSKRKEFFKNNMSFLLTLFITYAFGLFFIILAIQRQERFDSNELDFSQMADIAMENLAPTTVVYILGCLVNNMIEIRPILQGKKSSQSESRSIEFNVLTLIFLSFYTIFYCVYMYNDFSFWLVGIGIGLTFLVLCLNFQGYKEMHPSCIRGISS